MSVASLWSSTTPTLGPCREKELGQVLVDVEAHVCFGPSVMTSFDSLRVCLLCLGRGSDAEVPMGCRAKEESVSRPFM